jgi:DNA-binding response OmpR family regulator
MLRNIADSNSAVTALENANILEPIRGILLFEPDSHLLETRSLLLDAEHLRVIGFSSYSDILPLAANTKPSLAVLGLFPHERAAGDVATLVRHQWPHIPILLLGVPTDGFDDWLYDEYLAYGWRPPELLARVKALLTK